MFLCHCHSLSFLMFHIPALSFQEEPLQWAHALVFAVDEINRNPFLLPGVRLGYRVLDSCGQHPWSLRGALALVSGGNLRCETTELSDLKCDSNLNLSITFT